MQELVSLVLSTPSLSTSRCSSIAIDHVCPRCRGPGIRILTWRAMHENSLEKWRARWQWSAKPVGMQRSKRVEWAVLSLLILSLTSFSMGRSTTFLSAQHCADIFPRYPPCQLAFLFIAVIELLHACVRWTSARSSLLREALQTTHSPCCTLVH